MRTLIYVKVSEQDKATKLLPSLRTGKDTASIRVTEFWQGEVERCESIITDEEKVAAAYSKVGVDVRPFSKSEKAPEVKVIAKEHPIEVEGVEASKPRGRPTKGDK